MRVISSYPVALGGSTVKMPACPEPLAVQTQRGALVLWAAVDPQRVAVDVALEVIATGQDMSHLPAHATYLGTFQLSLFVGHVYWWLR